MLPKEYLLEHRMYFNSGATRSCEFRIEQLKKMKKAIKENEEEILNALYKDLKKSKFEGYATEVGMVYEELNFAIKNLPKWMKRKKVKTPITQFGSKSYIYSEPRGTVLIIAPWNYPFFLMVDPIIGAIASGNTILIKSSKNSSNVAKIINKIVEENYDSKYIRVIKGGRDEVNQLLEEKLDYIFFTGSVSVGKMIMEKASKHLTPVTLELGGKSPVIVDETANIKVAAHRIAWGKFLNCGQTCVAPDYIYVHNSVKNELINELKEVIKEYFGNVVEKSNSYARIVNQTQFDKILNLIDEEKVVAGGSFNKDELFIEPTIMSDITWDDAVMKSEIFGPLIPILSYKDINEVVKKIINQPKPLATYIFSENQKMVEELISKLPYGGGCVNDTVSHIATTYLPFGGFGNSGMGSYHGKASYDTFSHYKSVLNKSTKVNVKIAFPPFEGKLKKLKKLLK